MNQPSSLPSSSRLPIEHLSASLNKVTNSYKFFWLLSLLDHIRETEAQVIPIRHLLSRMMAGVWHPINHYRLSFGKQDRLNQIALAIRDETGLSRDSSKDEIVRITMRYTSGHSTISKEINSLGRYVPYRFLRPFFRTQLRNIADWKVNELIRQLTEDAFYGSHEPSLYRFVTLEDTEEEAIMLHPLWLEYLQTHFTIARGFCLWHLLNYLQKNNPNVSNLASKLHEPERRKLENGRRFWQFALEKQKTINCIYSGEGMVIENFSLDHFLPWSFVSHDLLWNIIPTPRSVNSAKGDQLPNFDLYFQPFARLQYEALQIVGNLGRDRLLEDYVLLFKKSSALDVRSLSLGVFSQVMHDNLAPQVQIARNMGFSSNWTYKRPYTERATG